MASSTQMVLHRNSSRRSQLDPEMWRPYESRIRQLYLEEKNTVTNVMKIVREETGFAPSLAQYNHQIQNIWNLRKNLSKEDIEYYNTKKRKRDEEGKKTRVKLCGVPQDDKAIKRKCQRTHYTVMEVLQKERSLSHEDTPQTPPGLDIGTPTTCHSPIMLSRDTSPFPFPNPGPLPRGPNSRTSYFLDCPLYCLTPSFHLEFILSEIKETFPKDLETVPGLRNMKEEVIMASDHWLHTNSFFCPAPSGPVNLMELVNFLSGYMIRLGNNIDPPEVQQMVLEDLLKSGFLQTHSAMLEKLTNSSNILLKDFAVRVFLSAAKTGNESLLNFILSLYDNPNHKTRYWRSSRHAILASGVQLAIEERQGHISNLLVQRGFDFNAPPFSNFSKSILYTAVLMDDIHIFNKLIDTGIELLPNTGAKAPGQLPPQLRNNDAARLVYKLARYPWFRPTNALELAVLLGREYMINRLLSYLHNIFVTGKSFDIDFSTLHFFTLHDYDPTSIYNDYLYELSGSSKGEQGMLVLQEILQTKYLNINVNRSIGGTFALWVALVSFEDDSYSEQAVKLLLQYGAVATYLLLDPMPVMDRDAYWLEYYLMTRWSVCIRGALEGVVLWPGLLSMIETRLSILSPPNPDGLTRQLPQRFFSFPPSLALVLENKPYIFSAQSHQDAIRSWLPTILGDTIISGLAFIENLICQIEFIFIKPREGLEEVWGRTPYLSLTVVFKIRYLTDLSLILKSYFSGKGDIGDSNYSLKFQKNLLQRDLEEFEDLCNRLDGLQSQRRSLFSHHDRKWTELCNQVRFDHPLTELLQTINLDLQSRNPDYLDYILEWVTSRAPRYTTNPSAERSFFNNLIASYLRIMEEVDMPSTSIHTLVQLAIEYNFHAELDKLLQLRFLVSIPSYILCEAVCSGDIKTFDRIWNFYLATSTKSEQSIAQALIVVAIYDANLFKVLKILELDEFDVDRLHFSNSTCLEISAYLGRLDIAKVLLDKGASKHFENAAAAALEGGHFTLVDLINESSKKIRVPRHQVPEALRNEQLI